jgi:hypothetical protein
MTWERIEIDHDEPGYCLRCLATYAFEELHRMAAERATPVPYPGRCLVCKEPLGPLRPLECEDA